jgi:hypothetical protein
VPGNSRIGLPVLVAQRPGGTARLRRDGRVLCSRTLCHGHIGDVRTEDDGEGPAPTLYLSAGMVAIGTMPGRSGDDRAPALVMVYGLSRNAVSRVKRKRRPAHRRTGPELEQFWPELPSIAECPECRMRLVLDAEALGINRAHGFSFASDQLVWGRGGLDALPENLRPLQRVHTVATRDTLPRT